MRHILRLIPFVLLFSFQIALAAKPTLSLEETVMLKRVSAASLSPDGSQIAYLLSVPRALYDDDDGKSWVELHIVSSDGSASRPFVSGAVSIEQFAWAHDGQSVFFVAKRDPDANFNALYEISLKGGEASLIFEHVNNIGKIFPSPTGNTLAFLASDAPPDRKTELETKGFKALVYEESVPESHVWMLDLGSQSASQVELDGSASELDWAPDGSRYAVALAPTPLIDDSYTSRDVFLVNAKTGAVQNKLNSVGKLGIFRWSPDAQQLAFVGSEDINDPREGRLYVTRTDGIESRNLLPEFSGHVMDLDWHDPLTITYLGARNLWTEVRRIDMREPQPAPPASKGGPVIRSIDSRPGSGLIAAIADTPEHPPEVYISKDGADWTRLTRSNPILNDRQLAKQEAIQYTARDGLQLDAVLIRPIKNARKTGKPLILFIHGGPEAHYSNGWMSNYSQPAHTLAAQGYTIAYPNYRGSTGRGVAFSKLGQNDYAEEEFNDIVDLKRHLVQNEGINPDKVGVSGGSYGGYASMWAASALSEEFAASVAFVGISNQLSKFGTGDIPREMYNVHSRAWPWDDWMWMLRRSPIYHADKTETPLLIMAGDKDPRVHPSQSLEMYRNVKLRTDTPVRLVFYPGEEHGNRNTAAQYDYSLRLERWMNHFVIDEASELPAFELNHAENLDQGD